MTVRLGFGFVWVIAGYRAELADLECRAAACSGEGGAAPRRYSDRLCQVGSIAGFGAGIKVWVR